MALVAVAHGRSRVRRSSTAELLWPDAPPARAASSLRSVLWRLPRPRGRALMAGDATDIWLGPDVVVDLWGAEDQERGLCGPQQLSPDLVGDLSVLRRDLRPGWHETWMLGAQEAFRQKRCTRSNAAPRAVR